MGGARPEHAQQDWYFFGYGHDYAGALAEYMRFGGKIPLIPRFVLGAWWSRYWAYSTQDMKDIVAGFEQHGLPLDVFIIDMDWHLPNTWTGYSWNRNLIPDPPALLDWLHKKGLKVTLNLHPAQGVQHFEDAYPEFARQMGLDPASQQDIPFRITDKRFVRSYFELLHHPMEDMGVNFWWMDWQQGDLSEMKGLDPLVWLNHIHFQDRRATAGGAWSTAAGAGWATTATRPVFRATRSWVAGNAVPALFYRYGLQRWLRLVGTRHRRSHGWSDRTGAVCPLGAVWRPQPGPQAARHQGPAHRAPPLDVPRAGFRGL